MQETYITVQRTARYFTLGNPTDKFQQLWFVCHGYGQLANSFLNNFDALDDGSRLIVAPEGLSRFYLSGTSGRIGASWMTREDRLNEIENYVNYLNAIYQNVLSDLPQRHIQVVCLGFSQGTSTVCRWIWQKKVPVDHLILWAGSIPPEIDFSEWGDFFLKCHLSIVVGDQDPYISESDIESYEARLMKKGVPYDLIRFKGGHQLDEKTLKRLSIVR
ncbi:MAG: phospholipase [Aliifodinibius sp.]|nr:phospholipase [candidate division Zixibacteria bacterium]NIT59624.1 phospholipase [Fodinibius sp.]NIS49193.1 phospholipase [candidate division Zixibacteria bacterium]NIU17300.1 phospholipase [candidate division Zixibacteria bacterium]NIV09420.1 phospholipase [candidate division Zixibacteria bacterium]